MPASRGLAEVNEIFFLQLKQTARIYGIQIKNGFGDYTAGFFGKIRLNSTSPPRRLFQQQYPPDGGDTS